MVRRILLVVCGLLGSCVTVLLLMFQVKPVIFSHSDLTFASPQSSVVQQQEKDCVKPVSESISLPYAINGTALVAEKLISYDGAFLENGSGREVSSVAALLLRNTSSMGISQAHIVLEQEEKYLIFKATQIPPGMSLLVLEENAKWYTRENITACYGWINWESDGWQPEKLLSFEEVDMGSLWVTNISESALTGIRLYYKTDYADGLFYLGGITYDIFIDSIGVGERILLKPEHYAGSTSKFLRIQWEEK